MPEATRTSTIGSQLIDTDCSFAGKSWKQGHKTVEGETVPCQNALS